MGRVPWGPMQTSASGRSHLDAAPVNGDAARVAEGYATSHTTVRVAVIDDDSGFLQVLGKRFERLGWQQRVLASPVPVDDLVAMRLGALVVDPALLGRAAWEYLGDVVARMPGLAIIVCTGRSSVAQRVRGLRMGVDDWLGKPCHPDELVARIEAVMRRGRRSEDRQERSARRTGELEIRGDQFQAFVAGRSAELTKREFELIDLLAAAEGRVLEREEIYQRVWGYAMARGDRSVDVFIRKLRQKLDKASPGWKYIHTHFGVGYRFAPERIDGEDAPTAPETAPTPDRAPRDDDAFAPTALTDEALAELFAAAAAD